MASRSRTGPLPGWTRAFQASAQMCDRVTHMLLDHGDREAELRGNLGEAHIFETVHDEGLAALRRKLFDSRAHDRELLLSFEAPIRTRLFVCDLETFDIQRIVFDALAAMLLL